MSHVLKHHGQRFSVCTHAVEPHYVFMLQHREQLGLALEVLPGGLVGDFQGLHMKTVRCSNTVNIRCPQKSIWILSIKSKTGNAFREINLFLDENCICNLNLF